MGIFALPPFPDRMLPVGAFSRNARSAGFTLVELLIVIAIMGLLGTVSVGGFYGLRRGMEQRSVMQTVDEFVRAAYRRAVIDRVPTAVYFWNETVSDEREETGGKLIVVGRAVAVRRLGRISQVEGKYLIDEFGDLSADAYGDEEGNEDADQTASANDPGRFLYQVGDTTFRRSVIATSSVRHDLTEQPLMSQPGMTNPKIKAYAYQLLDADGIDWKVGSPYGFEFAEMTLPKNYIFGNQYSKDVTSPEARASVMVFLDENTVKGGNVIVSGQKLDKSGDVSFEKIGSVEDPKKDR